MKRSFLFLQGPHGPFFQRLGHLLREQRHHVVRVNFNGGDVFDWSGPETIAFREEAEDWPDFLVELMRRNGTTDLVSFGDCRPLLEAGIRVAQNAGVRSHIFEEGYLRPDWITLEANGVNGKSTLPTDPKWYVEEALNLPRESPIKPTGNPIRDMMYHVSMYYTAKILGRRFFPNYKSHRPYNEWAEIGSWGWKLFRSKRQAMRDKRFQERFFSSDRPYFMFCLQLGSDSQIRRHSPFTSMKGAISEVLTSFADNLPPKARLLVKNHPLDPGLVDLEQFTLDLAKELDVDDRVFFTQGGNLPAYIKASEGVIVINSTVGMSSLHHRRPTIALGKAIYALSGLVNSNGLDSFWSSPVPPETNLYKAFKTVLIQKTQINGSFYTRRGIRIALPVAMDRVVNGERSVLRRVGYPEIRPAAMQPLTRAGEYAA